VVGCKKWKEGSMIVEDQNGKRMSLKEAVALDNPEGSVTIQLKVSATLFEKIDKFLSKNFIESSVPAIFYGSVDE
jgi:hypothetical protein